MTTGALVGVYMFNTNDIGECIIFRTMGPTRFAEFVFFHRSYRAYTPCLDGLIV
jgi:hypothetical protein